MTAESINMNEEEFESYFSGSALPPGSWQSSLLMCEGLQVMSQNIALLADLKVRQNKVLSEALKLKEEMNSFQNDIHTEVASALERTRYEIRGPKKPITVDDETLEIPSDLLPNPLQPAPATPLPPTTGFTPLKGGPPPSDLPSPLLPGPTIELPTPLLPSLVVGAAGSSPVVLSAKQEQIGIEDFLSNSQASDNMSLLDLSLTSQQHQQLQNQEYDQPNAKEEEHQEKQLLQEEQQKSPTLEGSFNEGEYRGFSAQSSSIPSISCDNTKKGETN